MLKKNFTLSTILFFAALVYIVTAYNSHGYYHADEHYQIIEFAGLKLGTHTPEELAWEFKAQIRPTLQPAICYVLIKTFKLSEINDPYSQAFLLRLISVLFALSLITLFIVRTKVFVRNKTDKTVYYLMSYLLWFTPLISSRFSSETWSSLLFLTSLSMFFKNSDKKYKSYMIGFLLGISFLFRYQMAFAAIGFGLWLIFVNKTNLIYILKITAGFLTVVLIGSGIDYWFYGELTFVPWNYFITVFESNNNFGISPWYYYLVKLLTYPTYFIGVPIAISVVLLIVFNRKHLILWIIIPFIIIHSFIPHKEERFLFPMIYLFPSMLISAYITLKKTISKQMFIKMLNYTLLIIFIGVNVVGLLASGQKSAGIGRMEITKHIHDNYGSKNINLIHSWWANPYNPWHSIPSKFYSEQNITDIRIDNLCELNNSLLIKDNKTINLLVIRKSDPEDNKCSEALKKNNFVFEIQSIPKWIEKLNEKYKGFENKNILELYKYKERK